MKLRLEEDVQDLGVQGDFVDIPDRFAYPLLSSGQAVRVEGCHKGAKTLPPPEDLQERTAALRTTTALPNDDQQEAIDETDDTTSTKAGARQRRS